jgi:phosphoglycerate kinase
MRSLDDLDVHGKRVLVRVDFNVPLAADTDGEPEAGGVPLVSDDTRIAAALATIEELRAGGARLVLVSHLGRPQGKPVAELSLAPVADRLRELTGAKVTLAPAVIGEEVTALAEELQEGDILVLENVRFEPGETSIARTRAPRASRTCCRARPDGCSNGRCGRLRESSSIRGTRSWRSSAARRWPTRSR